MNKYIAYTNKYEEILLLLKTQQINHSKLFNNGEFTTKVPFQYWYTIILWTV